MDNFMEAFAPQLMMAINAAIMTSILFMCKKKKPPVAARPAQPPVKTEPKEKSKKEDSKKSSKKSAKEAKSKKDSLKSKKSEKEKKSEKKESIKSPAPDIGVAKELVAGEKEKPAEGDKDKKEDGEEKKDVGEEKKEGELGGEQLPPKPTADADDAGQVTAIQLLKPDLTIEPQELRFSKDGGTVKMVLTNNTGSTVAVKVKCSDNDLFRVNPVFSFIEKNAKFVIGITRFVGAAKPDKLAVVHIEVPDDAKDPQEMFKQTPVEKQKIVSIPMFAN